MKLTFMGTSHGVPEVDRFCTSMLLQVKDSCYIIDAGAPVSPLLLRYGYTHEAVKSVFITHLHGDHFDGLFEFCDQLGWRYLNSNPRFLFPEEKAAELMRFYMNSMSATRRELNFESYNEGEIYSDENITVTAIPTEHSNLPSYAFAVSAEGKSLLFTGDMHGDLVEFDRLFKDKEYDLVVFEGAHTRLFEKADLLSKIATKQMFINHLYENRNPETELRLLAEKLPYKFSAAADGKAVII